MKKDNIIEVKNLKKSFGKVYAVRGISFEVKKGEIFGMLGPNGAGKTTTLEMMEGLRKSDNGTILVTGIDVSHNQGKVKNLIGVQLQSSAFFDNLTLTELIKFFASLYHVRVDSARVLSEVGLTEKAHTQVKKLSGGQKQRFSIASALVNKPEILFLDEPTTGLDPQARRHLWDLIREINNKGMTIVITTHYMDEAEELCDRVAVIDKGEIIDIDSPHNLVEKLINRGFKKKKVIQQANLEDVFLDLTGKALRES